ncbi:hypothetical protein DQ04_02531040 [Trypanosoma grayi]|uniref:hypothetical protein n=1 Tax=Trypanosoma grayi TaxID=71804 RepID=UPI0004F4246A|nr:hypothetical protein DQ04_02531040 [Trypanosoma grayi]KEG11528.1 hypothetical protein DQ04_02531040 [Trypanosoma grayi]
MSRLSASVTLLLLALLLLSSPLSAAVVNADAADEKSRYDHLQMLTVADLKQMLHEKRQPFLHLRTKNELINALVEVEKKEELINSIQQGDSMKQRKPHVLRVEYCSG